MRVSISDSFAPGNFPWNGSASLSQAALVNGESEDCPVHITAPIAVESSSWGLVKALYD